MYKEKHFVPLLISPQDLCLRVSVRMSQPGGGGKLSMDELTIVAKPPVIDFACSPASF